MITEFVFIPIFAIAAGWRNPAILKSVSCDTRASGAYFEQVTFERICFSVQRPRPESH